MTTNEASLHALNHEQIKSKYAASSIRTWRSRALRDKLSLDFMVEFLWDNGYALKQPMIWLVIDGVNNHVNGRNGHAKETDVLNTRDYKAQLNKKLYAVRKELSAELFSKWFDLCKEEYAKDFPGKPDALTTVVFSQMTYGRYISKENLPFAVKVLKEGKRILSEYQENIKREVESL
jgi:hypothetical protein